RSCSMDKDLLTAPLVPLCPNSPKSPFSVPRASSPRRRSSGQTIPQKLLDFCLETTPLASDEIVALHTFFNEWSNLMTKDDVIDWDEWRCLFVDTEDDGAETPLIATRL